MLALPLSALITSWSLGGSSLRSPNPIEDKRRRGNICLTTGSKASVPFKAVVRAPTWSSPLVPLLRPASKRISSSTRAAGIVAPEVPLLPSSGFFFTAALASCTTVTAADATDVTSAVGLAAGADGRAAHCKLRAARRPSNAGPALRRVLLAAAQASSAAIFASSTTFSSRWRSATCFTLEAIFASSRLLSCPWASRPFCQPFSASLRSRSKTLRARSDSCIA
mmetsp:Transcript_15640/g.34488  ORF Transcript_15640/g.34488 Transcript_15640/m.34488 type:complete len:223 (-) Transcript_15640:230-898(-)